MRMRMGSSILQFIFRGMKGGGRMMSTSSIGKISSPWLMLPSSSSSEALYSKFYSLAETKVVSIKKEAPPPPWAAQGEVEHLGCSHGWVASYNNDNRQTFLSDPITGRHIKLPDVHTLSYSPSSRTWPFQIILSSPPAAHDCRAIMTYGSSFHLGISVCFPAHTSTTWLPVCGQGSYSEPVYSVGSNTKDDPVTVCNVKLSSLDDQSVDTVLSAREKPITSLTRVEAVHEPKATAKVEDHIRTWRDVLIRGLKKKNSLQS